MPSAVVADLRAGEHRGVVDSPPGVGESTLVVRAAVELAAASEPVMALARTHEQFDASPTTEWVHLNVPLKFPDSGVADWSILSSLEGPKTPAYASVRRGALPQLGPILQEGI